MSDYILFSKKEKKNKENGPYLFFSWYYKYKKKLKFFSPMCPDLNTFPKSGSEIF